MTSLYANAARLWLTPCSQRRPRRAASAARLSTRPAASRNQRPTFSTVSTQVSDDSRCRRSCTPLTVRHQHLQFVRLRFSRFVVLGLPSGKQIPPAACHVLVAPLARDVRPVSDHDVNLLMMAIEQIAIANCPARNANRSWIQLYDDRSSCHSPGLARMAKPCAPHVARSDHPGLRKLHAIDEHGFVRRLGQQLLLIGAGSPNQGR